MSACKTCGAPVRWVRGLDSVDVPLDEPPVRRFVVRVDATGPYASGMEYCAEVDAFTSHKATCPNANGHRKARAR